MKYWQKVKIKSWFYEWLEWCLLHEWDEKDNYLIAMDILRDMAQKNEVYNDDMYAWLVSYEFIDYEKSNEYWEVSLIWYLYLEWYKSRGKTDRCINMETLQPLTLELAYKIWKNNK